MRSLKLFIIFLAAALLLSSSSLSTPALAAASNAASGDTKVNTNVISFIDSQTIEPVGQSTVMLWTFHAKKTGTYKIIYTYSRPWEKDAKDLKTIVFQIKVSKKSGTKDDIVTLTDKKVNKIRKNQKFMIALVQNASTGYSWSYVADKKGIHLDKEEDKQARHNSNDISNPVIFDLEGLANMVGAPSEKMWTFRADKAGTYKIVFTYSRSWEKEDTDAKTVIYTVKITSDAYDSNDHTALALSEDKETTLKLGQYFTVSLSENISTGYSWNYEISDND